MGKKMIYDKKSLVFIDYREDSQKLKSSELSWLFKILTFSSTSSDIRDQVEQTFPVAIIIDCPEEKLDLISKLKKKLPNSYFIGRSDIRNEEKIISLLAVGIDFILPADASSRLIFSRIATVFESRKQENETLKVENLEMNSVNRTVFVSGQPVKLSDLEFRLLLLFASNRDKILKRDFILQEVWGRLDITKRTIDTHVVSVRKKIVGFKLDIHSIYGVGYVLRGPEFR
jgi:DNA-binding response OmpR family regulator